MDRRFCHLKNTSFLCAAAIRLLCAVALVLPATAAPAQPAPPRAAQGPAGPQDSACIRVPPAATGIHSLRDLARVVMSTYGRFQGRTYPIFIARTTLPNSIQGAQSRHFVVALAGVDANGGSAGGQGEINSWATAFGELAPYQLAQYDPYARAVVAAMAKFNMNSADEVLLAGHSLGGIIAQNLAFYAVPAAPLFSNWSQVSGWPRTRIIMFGSPRVNFSQLLGPSGTIEEITRSPVRFFAAWYDPAVNGPAALPYRFRAPPVLSQPPWFNWIDAQIFNGQPSPHTPQAEAHFLYHVSTDMLRFNPVGDAVAARGPLTLQLDPIQQYRCTGMPGSPPPYAFGTYGPNQQPPNCALVSLATMLDEVGKVRQVLPSAAKRTGNVAVAHIVAPGVPCFLAASSQLNALTSDQQRAIGLVGAATGRYATSPTPHNAPPEQQRANTSVDTENKILDEVARYLDWDPGREGVIQLFTERPPCDSCSNVIATFSRNFPRITLMVLDNDGSIIPPAGP